VTSTQSFFFKAHQNPGGLFVGLLGTKSETICVLLCWQSHHATTVDVNRDEGAASLIFAANCAKFRGKQSSIADVAQSHSDPPERAAGWLNLAISAKFTVGMRIPLCGIGWVTGKLRISIADVAQSHSD
jgi:hypothetical protein